MEVKKKMENNNSNNSGKKNYSPREALIHARKVSMERFNKMREKEKLISEVEKRIVEKYNLKAK